ncbi:hypothetical protein ABT336_08980 [Micromonospora sp. NPDC000207]|uniref:nSTAND3 domain-containing NTPase n=1 Tax=Micromonospora sp. NPDC000207 TaxID=3154246 RepID=UPI00331C2B5A
MLRSQSTRLQLEEVASTQVEMTGFDQAAEQLRDQRVILLQGIPGTGRRTTAEMLLRSVADPENGVAGIEVSQSEVSLADLAGEKNLLAGERATILELAGPTVVSPGTLRTFEKQARDAEGFLVILDERTVTPEPALLPYTVRHLAPRAENVLRRHLLRILIRRRLCVGACPTCSGTCRSGFVERCLAQEAVSDELARHPRPAEVVELAGALAAWTGGEDDLHTALVGLRRDARRRELAGRLLRQDTVDLSTEDPQTTPRRQALQIAYAAFHGYPLADVFAAAHDLHTVMHRVQGRTDQLSRVIFDGGVDQMLRLSADEAPLAAPEVDEIPRRARLADPQLWKALLDAAWHDFDATRVPLLLWLENLVLHGREGVRQRAAYLMGWLATYDFDVVCNTMVSRWAASQQGSIRQAAVWALNIAALDPRLLGRVRGRTRDWAASRSPHLHDAAARAYGTSLGALAPEEALGQLRKLASRDDLNGSASVARSLVVLYDAAPEATWRTLVEWQHDDLRRLRVHGARGLTLLARRAAPEPDQVWPLLLHAGGDFQPKFDDLVEVWRTALTEPTTAFRAWQTLSVWTRLGDEHDEIAEQMVALLSRLSTGSVASRGTFYLNTWRRQSATARRVLEARSGSSTFGDDPTPPGGNR